MKKQLMYAAISAAFALSPLAHAEAVHWTYEGAEGPAYWGDLSPDYHLCKDGKKQSPIDVRPTAEKKLPAMWFSYTTMPLHVVNNGHTIQVSATADSYVIIGGEKYKLLQFHFHTPSEHLQKGRSYPMEAHFVHINSLNQLAVVGVMMREGETANGTFQKILDNMPATKGEVDVANTSINGLSLMPRQLNEYANYSGSLTTPPCSEGVRWFVMEDSISVSREQVEKFRTLFEMNARPAQPLNGRSVVENDD